MSELTEKEQTTLNAGRLMRAEADVLLPLLQTKQALVIGKIVAEFRAAHYEALTGLAAELSTIISMKDDITRAIKQAETLERKAFDNE